MSWCEHDSFAKEMEGKSASMCVRVCLCGDCGKHCCVVTFFLMLIGKGSHFSRVPPCSVQQPVGVFSATHVSMWKKGSTVC